MWKSPALNFVGCASAKKAPLSECSVVSQAGDPVALERELAVHVVVAGEAGRDQVAGAVLDPLHRPPDQQRGRRRDDVARVDRHLVAEAAADVRRDDPDLMLGQPRHDREQRAVGVRRLRGHVDRRLAGRRVHVGDAAAALERRRVAARVEACRARRPDRPRRRRGRSPPCRRPPSGRSWFEVWPSLSSRITRRVRPRAPAAGVVDRRQRLVVDVDQLERVLRDVRGLGDHRRDLLALEAHLVGREHGLGVAGERRHPGEVVLRPSARRSPPPRRPGAPAAREVSIERMRACANGLRSSSRWSMPGSLMSST